MKTRLLGEFPAAAALETSTDSPESNANRIWPGTLERGRQASTQSPARRGAHSWVHSRCPAVWTSPVLSKDEKGWVLGLFSRGVLARRSRQGWGGGSDLRVMAALG